MAKISGSRWTIDRFEENFAVLENGVETIIEKKSKIPRDVREGTDLIWENDAWRTDDAETAARAARIKERFERIKAGAVRE